MNETSFQVLGNEHEKKWWLWVFRTDTDILLVFHKSRGRYMLSQNFAKILEYPRMTQIW